MDVLPRNILYKVQILNSLSEWSWLENPLVILSNFEARVGRYHVSQAMGQFSWCCTKMETSLYSQILSSGWNVQPYADYQIDVFFLFCETVIIAPIPFTFIPLWNIIVGKHMVDLYKSLEHPKHWRPTRGKHRTQNKNTTTV